MKNIRFSVVTFIILIVAFLAHIIRDTHYFKRENVAFQSPKIPADSKITILQISDLHNHVFGAGNERLVNAVKKANADIIVLTGDLIDRRTKTFQDVFSFIDRLTAIHPSVLFVTGNHEWANPGTDAFLNGLHARGVTVLHNQNTQITKGNVTFNVVGVDDTSAEYADLGKALRGINSDAYTVLLSHSPGITKIYNAIPADLILSGHTHGGQIRLPLIGSLVAPGQGLLPELDQGTYQLGPDRYLYIDSGLGTTRLPVRFLNQSQLSLITISGED